MARPATPSQPPNDDAETLFVVPPRSVDPEYRASGIMRANSPWQKAPLHSTGDASRLTALFLGRIWPICSSSPPCQPGASPVSVRRGVSPRAAKRARRAKAGHSQGGPGAPTTELRRTGRPSRVGPKGLRSSTGPSRGGDPMTNRSAKGGARSSLHYGGEGALIHPPPPRCMRTARYGRPVRDPGRPRRVRGRRRGNRPYKRERSGKGRSSRSRTAE